MELLLSKLVEHIMVLGTQLVGTPEMPVLPLVVQLVISVLLLQQTLRQALLGQLQKLMEQTVPTLYKPLVLAGVILTRT